MDGFLILHGSHGNLPTTLCRQDGARRDARLCVLDFSSFFLLAPPRRFTSAEGRITHRAQRGTKMTRSRKSSADPASAKNSNSVIAWPMVNDRKMTTPGMCTPCATRFQASTANVFLSAETTIRPSDAAQTRISASGVELRPTSWTRAKSSSGRRFCNPRKMLP